MCAIIAPGGVYYGFGSLWNYVDPGPLSDDYVPGFFSSSLRVGEWPIAGDHIS